MIKWQFMIRCFIIFRLQMDVTDKESILKVKTYIEEKEGKLHVLVNKLVQLISKWLKY
jgi:hypothetical protein